MRSEVIEATTQTTPNDATHWSCRSMARHLNTTRSFVNRVWRAHALKPHLIRTFKLSNDPRFEEKLRDVVGLYLDPPHNAAVFSFDEKSQIQALDRTQPGLPMKQGRCATMTHDYKRHGTTTLFAALNMATGEVIGKTYRKHRHQEVLRFLREVEKTVPEEQEIHIVLDNYATHKHEKCSHGSNARSASSSTSSRPARLGPIWSSGSLPFSRKNKFVEVSLHRCRIWRSACASIWRATTRIHAPWSGQRRSRKSSKRSVGVERSYPKQLNHYLVKDTTLGPYLQGAKAVVIEDPYIRLQHQIQNFVRFCETVLKAGTVKKISLVTGYDDGTNLAETGEKLDELKQSLLELDVELEVKLNPNIHDREIRLDNGWIIKIGRVLDFYQKPGGWFEVGANDLSLRKCLETKVDIFRG